MKIADLFAEFRQTGLTRLVAGIQTLGAHLKKTNATLTKFSSHAKKVFLVTGGIMAVAAREAIKFQTQMTMVATMLDQQMLPIMSKFEQGVQSLSVQFGQSTATLAKGLFDILSASVAPGQALEVLRVIYGERLTDGPFLWKEGTREYVFPSFHFVRNLYR